MALHAFKSSVQAFHSSSVRRVMQVADSRLLWSRRTRCSVCRRHLVPKHYLFSPTRRPAEPFICPRVSMRNLLSFGTNPWSSMLLVLSPVSIRFVVPVGREMSCLVTWSTTCRLILGWVTTSPPKGRISAHILPLPKALRFSTTLNGPRLVLGHFLLAQCVL